MDEERRQNSYNNKTIKVGKMAVLVAAAAAAVVTISITIKTRC